MHNNNQTNDSFMMLLKGMVIGGVLGVLFAPQKGEVMRRQLKKKLDETANDITTKTEDFKKSFIETKDNIVESVEDTGEKVSNQVSKTKDNIENKVNDKKRELRDKVEDMEKENNRNM